MNESSLHSLRFQKSKNYLFTLENIIYPPTRIRMLFPISILIISLLVFVKITDGPRLHHTATILLPQSFHNNDD